MEEQGCTVRVQERRAGEGQNGWLPPGSPGSDLCWPWELRSGGAGGLSLAMGSPAGSPGSDPVRVELGAGGAGGIACSGSEGTVPQGKE